MTSFQRTVPRLVGRSIFSLVKTFRNLPQKEAGRREGPPVAIDFKCQLDQAILGVSVRGFQMLALEPVSGSGRLPSMRVGLVPAGEGLNCPEGLREAAPDCHEPDVVFSGLWTPAEVSVFLGPQLVGFGMEITPPELRVSGLFLQALGHQPLGSHEPVPCSASLYVCTQWFCCPQTLT